MILITHILCAISSLAFVTFAFISPSRRKQKISQLLAGATLTSGTVLVITSHSNILQSCLTGIVYFSVVSVGIFAAERRLARQED